MPSRNSAQRVSYYLRNRKDVERYLKKRKQQAVKIRKQNESQFDTQGIRERLLARQSRTSK